MTPKNSHKVIAAVGMVVVIAVAGTVFALRSSHTAPVVAVLPPAATVAEPPAAVPEAPVPVAAEPAPVAEVPARTAAVAQNDIAAINAAQRAARVATDPAPARKRRFAEEPNDAVAASRAPAPSEIVVADIPSRTARGDVLTMPELTRDPGATEVAIGTSSDIGASDSQITADVKTAIASDSLGKDSSIGVTTTRGAVVLTGSAPTQVAIDQVKDVAGKVKDVKSVDATGLILASL
jgi:hypothetical protein